MPDKHRVLVVDDNAVLRDALRAVLERTPDIEVIGEGADGDEAIHEVRRLSPDVILMDVRMPGMSGEEATRQLKQLAPSAKVVALSAFGDEDSIQRMLDAGAVTCVRKTGDAQAICTAIRNAATAKPDADSGAVTSEQVEILRRFAQGYPLRQIAQAVGLEVAVVERYKTDAMKRLGLTTRAEVALAVQERWN